MMTEEGIAKEIPLFLSALNALKTNLNDSDSHVKSLVTKITNDKTDRSKGLSFLDMKLHLVLDYLINLTYTMILKVDGKSLVGEPCIERLVEIRTVLEKIRPINKKLSYQIDKLIKMASSTDAEAASHPLSFKPNLDNLVGKDAEEDEHSEEEKGTGGVYVPPRVTAVHYEDETKSKKEKQMQKARQRSLNSALLQDLRSEYCEAPEEIKSSRTGSMRAKMKQREEEREQFEEANFRRLAVTKKERMMKRKLDDLDTVIKIGSFHGVESAEESDDGMYRPSKKKGKGKKDKFKKKFTGGGKKKKK